MKHLSLIILVALLLGWGTAFGQTRSVAVTFDDLPGTGGLGCDERLVLDVNQRILASLQAHTVPSIGFVNEGRTCVSLVESVLRMWLDTGMEIGNHTATHPDLNDLTVEAYQQDIINGEAITRRLLQDENELRYFRFPYLHAGDTEEKKAAIEQFLTDRGYTNAPVTIDSDEWLFAHAYAQAIRQGQPDDELERIRSAYIEWMETVVTHYEGWSVEVLGYEPPQVLLLHVNQLNADTFDELAVMFQRRGYRFISLEDALSDGAYAQPDPYVGQWGISWLHRWARGKGMEVRWEPDAPEWIAEYGD